MDQSGSPSRSPVLPKRKRSESAPTRGDSSRRVGTRLGRYRITGHLGQGGMGTVFEARDLLLKRPVAIKILPDEVAKNSEALARFVREAQEAARLNHAHVVTVYDIGKSDGTCFIVMELVSGGSAQEILRSRGPFHWREATDILIDVCRGVVAAHQAGIIHRDIKPSNILRSGDGIVKLADFGLAKPAGVKGNVITSFGEVIGTPHYMSPEQSRCSPLDARSDIYSLGATYFALLTGRPPFVAEHSMQILMAHCGSPIPDPREWVADVPETCEAIIRKAMAKDRSHRYANAEELHADLNLVMAEAGTSDPRQPSKPPAIVWPKKDLKDLPDSLSFAEMYPGERTAPVTPRRRLKRSIVLTGVIMLVTLVLTAVLFVRRESPEREPVSAVVASMDSATLAGEIDLAIRRRDVPEMKKALDRVQRTLKSAEASLPGARDSLRRAATRIEKAIEFRERIIEGGFALGLDGAVTSLRVSPKDDWIVVGQTHGSAGAIVFDFHTGETRHALWPRRGNGMARVHGLAVTHDNSTIAAACADNRVRFWNVGSGKESSFYLGQGVTLAQAVAFSPTARTVVVGLEPIGEGKGRPYVKSWNLDNNREPFTFKMEHSAKVWTVDFTAGGHQVATGSDDQRVVFWNATNGRIWREIRTGMAIRAIACDPRGRIIAVAGRKDSESCLQFWDYAAEQQLASRIVPHGNCDCVAFSRNGKLLAAGSGSRILLWNPETQTVAATLTGQAQNVTALAFSADGTILVSGGEDKMVRFWDVARCLSRPIPP